MQAGVGHCPNLNFQGAAKGKDRLGRRAVLSSQDDQFLAIVNGDVALCRSAQVENEVILCKSWIE